MEDSISVIEISKKLIGLVTIQIDVVGNIGDYIRMIAVDRVFSGSRFGGGDATVDMG